MCGHGKEAHEHYRRGTDCSLCPAGECTRFRSAHSLVGRVMALFHGHRPAERSAVPGRPVLTLVRS
jgi:hypothetical protein